MALAHEQRQQRARRTHQRARDDHRQIVNGKTIRRHRQAGEGIQQRDDDRHVRPADGHDHGHAEEQCQHKHDDERRRATAAGTIVRQPAAQADNDEQDEAVQKVLPGERVRLFKFPLEFQISDDAAGKGERADERGEEHGAGDERGQSRADA